jgi:hypothetical protein
VIFIWSLVGTSSNQLGEIKKDDLPLEVDRPSVHFLKQACPCELTVCPPLGYGLEKCESYSKKYPRNVRLPLSHSRALFWACLIGELKILI